MKNIVFIWAISFCLVTVYGQGNSKKLFLSSTKKTHTVFIEINDQSAYLFRLGYWNKPMGSSYSLIQTDTLSRQRSTDTYLFIGTNTKIQKDQNKLYVLLSDTPDKKVLKIEIDTVTNETEINQYINNGYWHTNFSTLSVEVNAMYPIDHYSFYEGYRYWDRFTNTQDYYQDFRVFADNRLKIIRDSVIEAKSSRSQLTQHTVNNISTISYTELKNNLIELSDDSERRYFSAIVHAVCMQRTDLLFKLADDNPSLKEKLLYSIQGKEAIQKIRATETNSTFKREVIKDRRQTTAMLIKIGTLYAALGVLVVYLIAR
ncbi:hypothetical protein QNI19_16275 [Cytophagaceae bacterium DM2B3-1]|uniref:DUF4369 domain-containing protein n=1 Tax=Xanthocytophaga flava TaxID=3048013 RepID=A0ABT7CLD2_9BACT|nr:hypothetical protein [Xanthocytophaga flavus]MDJ1468134.1 hypothetical protein [Xanthocytophaga flavus]MDJ1494503.1 hypothetical protein [Xanthocytophaga flavus]